MHKLVRALVIALVAVAALAALAAGLSRLIYGRSLRATAYEWKLRRDNATVRTAEEEIARLEARRAKRAKPYKLRSSLSFSVDVREQERAGMQVFTLNGSADSGVSVLYLHGGAYINQFNSHQWRFMDCLARDANCVVVAPAYPLAPWTDYRLAQEQLLALYGELLGERPERLILMGDSAGGGLALALAQSLVERGEALPERLILFSPWVDVSMDNPDILDYVAVEPMLHLELITIHGQYWAGGGDTHDWHVSPLYGDMRSLPPVTIYCGTRELLYPDIMLARDALGAAGVEVDMHIGRGMNHDYPLMPLPEAETAVREVVATVMGTPHG